uniref:Uncharacterized protein LOC104235468 n=1 Tax=Nicotiana sylvestris TaxID=4096 RepID=A0A1U7XM23_NICSY
LDIHFGHKKYIDSARLWSLFLSLLAKNSYWFFTLSSGFLGFWKLVWFSVWVCCCFSLNFSETYFLSVCFLVVVKVMMLYDQAFSKLRAELTHREEEFEKLSTESRELKTLYARREEELNSLRAGSKKMLQERANFTELSERMP